MWKSGLSKNARFPVKNGEQSTDVTVVVVVDETVVVVVLTVSDNVVVMVEVRVVVDPTADAEQLANPSAFKLVVQLPRALIAMLSSPM